MWAEWSVQGLKMKRYGQEAPDTLYITVQYPCSLAADIVDSRLELAKQAGANVTINCLKENLKERG